jgi:hypothetical protein
MACSGALPHGGSVIDPDGTIAAPHRKRDTMLSPNTNGLDIRS